MTVAVRLTNKGAALIDERDEGLVSAHRWRGLDDHGTTYAVKSGRGPQVRMHRLIMEATDPAVKVDHRDGNGLNNTRANLRLCSNAENIRNQRPHADKVTSKYKGVYRDERGRIRAAIQVNRKKIVLGQFTSEILAARAYDHAARLYHGKFARTNFSEQQLNNNLQEAA